MDDLNHCSKMIAGTADIYLTLEWEDCLLLKIFFALIEEAGTSLLVTWSMHLDLATINVGPIV